MSTISKGSLTRTVAILTSSSATTHRLSIESVLLSSGFEILLSRTEQWSYPADGDFLDAFLHDDDGDEDEDSGEEDRSEKKSQWIYNLTSGPIRLMILERHRAVQTWLDLLGPANADESSTGEMRAPQKTATKKKLREIYGVYTLYGSSTDRMAERQGAICAPELASDEALQRLEMDLSLSLEGVTLDDDHPEEDEEQQGNDSEVSERSQEAEGMIIGKERLVFNEQGQVFVASTRTGDHLVLEEQIDDSTAQHHNEAQRQKQERQASDAVAARLSQRMKRDAIDSGYKDEKAAQSPEKGFRARPVPASHAKPSIQPRLSRAAALRMGVTLPTAPVRQADTASPSKSTASEQAPLGISGLPKSQVALPKSLAPPSVQPRANRASLARLGIGGDSQPGVPREKKQVDFSTTPGHRRAAPSITNVASLAQPKIAPRQNRASLARVGAIIGVNGNANSGMPALATIIRDRHSSVTSNTSSVPSSADSGSVDYRSSADAKRRSLASTAQHQVASLRPPAIVPRTNRAAIARGVIVTGANLKDEKENRPRSSISVDLTSPNKGKIMARPSLSNSQSNPAAASKQAAVRERVPVDFSSTPGHRRDQTFALASLAPPKIQPRTNIAATKRLSVGGVGGLQGGVQPSPERPQVPSGGRRSVLGMASGSRPSTSMASARPLRPASVAGASGVSQGRSSSVGFTAQTAVRVKGAAPPSAYRSYD